MDFKGLLKRILPRWTLFNLIVTAISVVSAFIIYLTQNVLPPGLDLLQIVAGLYFSKENQGYYILAVQNVIAVVVLYALKIAFNFDLTPIIG